MGLAESSDPVEPSPSQDTTIDNDPAVKGPTNVRNVEVQVLSEDAEGFLIVDSPTVKDSTSATGIEVPSSPKGNKMSIVSDPTVKDSASAADIKVPSSPQGSKISEPSHLRPGPTRSRQPDAFTCPDLNQFSVGDPRRSHEVVPVLAFYFPGHAEPWDEWCKASFLGNFFELEEELSVHPKDQPDRAVKFTNAEAAFQALKFWGHASEFARLSGHDAFTLKKQLSGKEDWKYSGYGSNWDAMEHVLREKFRESTKCAEYLKKTGEAFLLEHNSVPGRDSTWSDNNTGNGQNWLGLQLMKIRDQLSGKEDWTKFLERHIDLKSGRPCSQDWQKLVQGACDAVRQKGPKLPDPSAAGYALATCGCGKPTWNGQWNEKCRKSCQAGTKPGPPSHHLGARGGGGGAQSIPFCGCGKPTWNGKWNELCRRSCPGPKMKAQRG